LLPQPAAVKSLPVCISWKEFAVANAARQAGLDEPVIRRMHQNYTALRADQTVAAALEWLRQHPPSERIIYFYVVDDAGVLKGVVPTRRLILSAPDARLADIMVAKVTALPAQATVLEACEFFILHRLLAFPVVDAEARLIGVVDIDLYTGELDRLGESTVALRWLRPFARFLKIESAAGFVLLGCAIVAIVLANSPWAEAFHRFWETDIGVELGGFVLKKNLLHWINDGLMTLFFFVVGLEIKREFVSGELNEWRKAALPIIAAVGGMAAPAAVYLALQWGKPTAHGWGVPTATDIAFVVGFLVLLGPRVPHGLKVMLLSLAIVDDIGATLIIAAAYTAELSATALAFGIGGLGLVLVFRWIGVRSVFAYVALGVPIWIAFVKSGVHPTVAGVALGLLTPARPWLGDRVPFDLVTDLLTRIGALQGEQTGQRELVSPLERLEHALHPWVAFFIMPVFALANAGVAVEAADVGQPIAIAVAAGLIVGKPLGVVLFGLAAVTLGLAKFPAGVNAKVLVGAGCLAGIGFTMSIFIAGLAFDDAHHLAESKIGILVGSGVSATLGSLLLRWFLPDAGNGGKTSEEG
jgi:Na+:H+ antiporter, NhaA family